MASSRCYDQEIRFDGRDEDEDQDEVVIYSVSGRGRRGQNSRGMQASRFGAMDESIELQLEPNQSRNSISRVKSTQQRVHELGPSAYQTAMDQRNPSGSQERAEELDEAMERLLELVGFGKLQWLMLVVCGCGMLYCSVQLGFIGYLLPDIARDLCLSDASTGWLSKCNGDHKLWKGSMSSCNYPKRGMQTNREIETSVKDSPLSDRLP